MPLDANKEGAQPGGLLAELHSLQTGLEEEIEGMTECPYARLYLLALCLQVDGLRPTDLPLGKPFVRIGGPPFETSPYGSFDCLDAVEAHMLCEDALGLKFQDDSSDSPTILEFANAMRAADGY